jgi:hypothetical protein
MHPLKTYDLSKVILNVNGFPVTVFDEDAAISLENGSQIGEVKVGADGAPVFSRNNDKGLICTISLLETVVAYRNLAFVMSQQQLQPFLLPCPFIMRDLINGDQVSSIYAVFTERPLPSKSKAAGAREFKLYLPNPTVLYGSTIL